MSDNAHYEATEDAHTGPIKNPKQLLVTVFFAFVAPILIIVALVAFVVSGYKGAGHSTGDDMALYGVSQQSRDREIADRLKRVGSYEIRDANRELATGEAVFKAQCAACHGSPGIPGAPHFGDAAGWGPRIGQGFATLLEHALKGKGAMPPQGGGDFEDTEIGRAVVYLANSGGGKFPIPERPAAAAAADGAAAAAPAASGAAMAAAPAAPVAPAAPASPASPTGEPAGAAPTAGTASSSGK